MMGFLAASLSNPHTLIGALGGAALVASALFSWAVFIHGPQQYRAGALEEATRLHEASVRASKEIADAAERGRYLRRQCVVSGGVWDFATGKCKR